MNDSISTSSPHAVHRFVYIDVGEYPCPPCTTDRPGGSFALAFAAPALAAPSPGSPESAWGSCTRITSILSRRAASRFHVKTSWSSSAPATTGLSMRGGERASRSGSAVDTTTVTSGRGASASGGSTSTEQRRDSLLRADGEHPPPGVLQREMDSPQCSR